MREIKLRVPVYQNGVFSSFHIHELEVNGKSYSFGNCHFMGDYECKGIEEWTGLKDKNGVDIYEGDICKQQWRKTSFEIVFTNGAFRGVSENYDSLNNGFIIDSVEVIELEVIGNIHEQIK